MRKMLTVEQSNSEGPVVEAQGAEESVDAADGSCAKVRAAGLPQEEQGDAGSGPAESAEPADKQEEPLVPFKRVRDLQSQSDRLRHQLAQREEEVQSLRNSLQEAAIKYRQALLTAYPVIPEQLLSGSTVEELEESLERARLAVEKVRQKLEEGMARSLSVPAGAPVRRSPDLSALSPREKIVYGLGRK
ncbi:MAG: hypothetical protein Q8P59_00050 [Dehalococcoidia bacterium]|nr:hypothetical protein [Dehalococcoidia bacterium]